VHQTEVLSILRNMHIDEVVVAGVSTNLAIPMAVVGAADEDFGVTVVTDASVGIPAEHHASMLKHSLSFVARLATVDELLGEWSNQRQA
jgi:nicotinamidase-related amidase